MHRILYSLFCLLFVSSAVNADNDITVNLTSSPQIEIGKALHFLEDVDRQMTLADVTSLPKTAWRGIPEKGANFGFSDSAFWFTFDLVNSFERSELLLLVDYPVLDKVEFFLLSEDSLIEHGSLGDLQPFNARPIAYRSFLFPFSVESEQRLKILVRAESQGALQVPISLWHESKFMGAQQTFLSLYGVFVGILVVMCLYNLFLFLSIRDWSYFFYSVFTIMILGYNTSIDGLAYQWIWPESPGWHQVSVLFFNSFGAFSLCLFTLFYLRPNHDSRVRKALVVLSVLAGAAVVVSFVLPYRQVALYQVLVTVAVILGTAISGLVMLRYAFKEARFFLVAWSAFLFGTLLSVLSKAGVLPSGAIFEYSSMVGAVIGTVVLSLALADKIRAEREAKELAQHQAIGNLKKFFSIYKNALEGIFVLNARGKILSANPAMLKLLGVSDLGDLSGADSGSGGALLLDVSEYETLLRRIHHDKEVVNYETQLTNAKGEQFWVSVTARLSTDEEHGLERIEGTLININDRKAFESELQHLAAHDVLTGFLNRRAFELRAKDFLGLSRTGDVRGALLYMDLDQFKLVNDLCGHSAGDKLLRALSFRLQNRLQAYGTEPVIARLGGDEFGILLPGFEERKAVEVAEDLRHSIESFIFVWDGHRYPIGVSIGLVNIDAFHHSLEHLLAMADSACYLAKDAGRNRVHVFTESDQDLQIRKREMQWLSTLRKAMDEDQFFLVAQPIQPNLEQDSGFRYEVLLRLGNDTDELISPNQFLPAAERYRLMPSIDRWVVTSFFSWLRANPGHESRLSSASINLSMQSLGEASFSDFLWNALDEYCVDPSKICFEITESMAVTHLDNTQGFISRFRERGCRFALDDFGTGFSSYAYLKELMVDYIKIDGMFVKNLVKDEVDEAMVRSVHEVAKTMGIKTIAEFVESQAIQNRLVAMGVEYSQGFHIEKPIELGMMEVDQDPGLDYPQEA